MWTVLKKNSYSHTLPNGDEVIVGDVRWEEAFVPHVQLKRWGGECSLAVWLQEPGDLLEVTDHKVRWGSEAIEMETYPTVPRRVVVDTPWGEQLFEQCQDGGFEFNVILKKKPPRSLTDRLRKLLPFTRSPESFMLALPIETKGLKFYYQPPLHPEHPTWCEEPDGGYSVRPENVVGSYAVYHATRGNVHRSKSDGEKYRCGKAFHIYRPRIVDAAGNAVWGDLGIDEDAGLMVVEIPWKFLDSAVYPVRHAAGATFGYETIGSSSGVFSDDVLRVSLFTCPESGTVESLTAYCQYDSSRCTVRWLIYSSDSGYPGSLVDYTEDYYYPSDAGWYTLSAINGASLSAADYFLGSHQSRYLRHYWDSGATYYEVKDEFDDGSPDPFPPDRSPLDVKMSIYCTYTPSGPPPAAPRGWMSK